jgi:hypothetical protein
VTAMESGSNSEQQIYNEKFSEAMQFCRGSSKEEIADLISRCLVRIWSMEKDLRSSEDVITDLEQTVNRQRSEIVKLLESNQEMEITEVELKQRIGSAYRRMGMG